MKAAPHFRFSITDLLGPVRLVTRGPLDRESWTSDAIPHQVRNEFAMQTMRLSFSPLPSAIGC